MKSNVYSDGKVQVVLKNTDVDVKAKWAHESWAIHNLEFVNRAFEIYYNARCTLNKLAGTDWDHYWAMWKELEACAKKGYGFGVDDLDEAFQHLVEKGGRWTHDDTSSYYCNPHTAYCPKRKSSVRGPESVVEFMNAVDVRIGKLRKEIDRFCEATDTLNRQLKSNMRRGAAKTLGTISTIAGAAKPFLWTAPISLKIEDVVYKGRVPTKHVTGTKKVPGAPYQTRRQRIWSGTMTYVQVVAKLDQAACVYAAGARSGTGKAAGGALAAMQFVVDVGVPVLGGFYAEAIKVAPGMVTNVRAILRDKVDRLDSAGKTLGPK